MSPKTILFPMIPRHQTRAAGYGDWKTKPMPEQSVKVKLNKSYSDDEMEKIKWGYIPEQMEDK